MSGYRLEVFEPRLLDQIVRLRKQVFGGSIAFNHEYLTWKYLKNPYLPEPLLCVVRCEGEVVGMRGWFGTSWMLPGTRSPEVLPCAAETAITPDHRDRGLFKDLTEFSMADLKSRGFTHAINMSANPANYVTSIMTMGWNRVGTYESLIRSPDPIGIQALAEESRWGRPSGGERLRAAVQYLRAPRSKAPDSGQFRQLDGHMHRAEPSVRVVAHAEASTLARIAAQCDDNKRILHQRDETYFRWRYRNPAAMYRFLLPRGGEPDWFAVLQNTGPPPIRLVDWGGSEDHFADLLDAVIELGRPTRLSTWGATSPKAVKQGLERVGFVSDLGERRRGLLVKVLVSAENDGVVGTDPLLDIAGWNLRMIFSDRF